MPYGYWGKFSRKQCKIQLSKYNLGEQKVLESAFFGFQKGLKFKTFTLVTTIDLPPEYAGFITNLPFWATQRLERRTILLINLETAYIFWVVGNDISGNPKIILQTKCRWFEMFREFVPWSVAMDMQQSWSSNNFFTFDTFIQGRFL